MLKKGFTLSEVLVTLGIIGVVAALTLPGLMTDTSSAQIGPKLAKARAMFEQGNQALLNNENLDSLVLKNGELYYANAGDYLDSLSAHYRINSFAKGSYSPTIDLLTGMDEFESTSCALSNDGMLFCVALNIGNALYDASASSHKQIIGTVYVDIDGKKGANTTGTDVFPFVLTAGGAITPVGATDWDNQDSRDTTWEVLCPRGNVSNYSACTGHVFENDLKAEYN